MSSSPLPTPGFLPTAIGRGAGVNPANRFEHVHAEIDLEQQDAGEPLPGEVRVPTQFLPDRSRTVIAHNNSPDVKFDHSINPYRGCEHGCAYCYARPGHEYLGMNAGLDFESKILVKHDIADCLRAELADPRWKGDLIAISGVTDCYQPAERRFRLTRACLEVMLEARQPLGIVTKNALVTRDLDLLVPLAQKNLVHVFISLTTLETNLARTMEPRTATPAARLRAIRELSSSGVPTGVLTSPIIPGLNDQEIPALLAAAKDAGAHCASSILLRLPLAVRPIFEEWVTRAYPDKAARILALIRETRGGKMNDSQFGSRMRGQGNYAEGIRQTFDIFRKKLGLDRPLPPLDHSQFAPPQPVSGQLRLF
jgi:DNA repair photolyase